MKRKNLIALALCLALTLTACDEATTSGNVNSQQNQGSTEKLPILSQEGTISETVLYNQNNVKITANELSYKYDNAVLSVTVENNSSKELEISSGTLSYGCNSVNGYMVDDGYFYSTIAAGESETKDISFRFENLAMHGITEIADIEVGFCIDDDDKEIFTGPLSVKTQLASGYNYERDTYLDTISSRAAINTFNYEVLYFGQDTEYNEGGVKLISNTLIKNKDDKLVLLSEYENTSNKDVRLGLSDITLNHLTNRGLYSENNICAGKRYVTSVNLYYVFEDVYMDLFGINEIGNIKMAVYQKDNNNNTLAAEMNIEIKIPGKSDSINSDGTVIYDSNGIKVTSKGVIPSPSDMNDDMYLMLLIENNSGKDIWISDDRNEPLVNGKETDSFSFYEGAKAGTKEIAYFDLRESSLKDNGITSPEDIKTVEWVMTVNTDNDKLDEVKVKIEF